MKRKLAFLALLGLFAVPFAGCGAGEVEIPDEENATKYDESEAMTEGNSTASQSLDSEIEGK